LLANIDHEGYPEEVAFMSFDVVWEQVFKGQAWGKYPNEDLVRFVARHFYRVADRGAVRILEVGCGPGSNQWYMAREGFFVVGVDGSATAIAQAKSRLDSECPGWKGELLVGDITRLDFEDESFDAVVDSEAVYCNSFDDSRQIYDELYRVCKPDGMLFSRTFAAGSWGDGTGEQAGHNAWLVSEGPCLNKGLARFTPRSEVDVLIGKFEILHVELLTRTMSDRKHEIKEWLIEAKKRK
jgi:SAM-dependent methyltransferase